MAHGRVQLPKSRNHRTIGFAFGAVVAVGLVAVFVLGSGDDTASKNGPNADNGDEDGKPSVVDPYRRGPSAASAGASDTPETTIAGRNVPPEIADKVRNWSPESTEFRQPEPGEEAPVRAHNLDTYDPTKPGPPPNPFIPPKRHLSEEDTRAGLDPVPAQD